MSRGTVKNKVEKATLEMKNNLHRQSFIGVTAHWIEPETLERCSAALAYKQLKGSHTFSALAGAMNDIRTVYNIREKIV